MTQYPFQAIFHIRKQQKEKQELVLAQLNQEITTQKENISKTKDLIQEHVSHIKNQEQENIRKRSYGNTLRSDR